MPACAHEGRAWRSPSLASSSSGSSPPASPVLIRANGTTRRFSLPLATSPLPPAKQAATAPSSPTALCPARPWPEPPPPEPVFNGWYPLFLLRLTIALASDALSRLAWHRLLLFWPSLLASAALALFWRALATFCRVLEAAHTSAWERARPKRTVLLGGGSTLQALHLARNFHDAGARVVVCESDGLFPLARFSAAVSAFHTVPRPEGRTHEYVCALCRIAEQEKAALYVPVSASSPAYYDALAKPHLEKLGVKVFCPSARDVCRLEDAWELMRRCAALSLPAPAAHKVVSREQVLALYAGGPLKRRMLAFTAGPTAARARRCVVLPKTRAEFQQKVQLDDLNELQPWAVVQDVPGEHLITCTTVRDSQVTANVTCTGRDGVLTPVNRPEVVAWVERFVAEASKGGKLSAHLAFHVVVPAGGGAVVPLACRVGVSLPYVCLSADHPRAVWTACRHADHAPGPILASAPRLWLPSVALRALLRPTVQCVAGLGYAVFKGREAAFVAWDPLPFFAHHCIQVPLEALGSWCGVLRATPAAHSLFDPFVGVAC
ncbi:uncharacterized protein LOC124170873 [Ischnura elegans]|uniref:uncharacterized protein LOC124170873 n=1 Tax=Ischnura elegans TaxID=197161 RepID=UPI001ED869C0|nr:uncharacterized protein LOC124170873 [Ischnura elegans]